MSELCAALRTVNRVLAAWLIVKALLVLALLLDLL